jgi:hypothetical protein
MTLHGINGAQRARLEALRDRDGERRMDVRGFDGDDDLLHVIVYGRTTGAELAVHMIALDGQLGEEGEPDSASPHDVVHADEQRGRR